MARKPLTTWKLTDKETWTCSLGFRGAKVRLFQKRKGGTFYQAVYSPGHGFTKTSLGVSDMDAAEEIGKRTLAVLLRGEVSVTSGKLTIGTLGDLYKVECKRFKALATASRKDVVSRISILTAYLGEEFRIERLSDDEFAGFQSAREKGGIKTKDGLVTVPVRTRSVQADFKILRRLIRWALSYKTAKGQPLLDRDPIADMKPPKSKEQPRGEIATDDRFEKTRAAIQDLRDRSPSEIGKMKWRRLELALVLVEETGRRVASVRNLRWSDIDLVRGEITWVAEHDKKRVKRVVPMKPEFKKQIETFSILLDGALGGLVFPRPENPHKVIRREDLDEALVKAETHAGLPKLDGTLWHAYRRRWATGVDDSKDAMYAGGWKDHGTFSRYKKVTDDGLRSVVMNRKSVPSVVGG